MILVRSRPEFLDTFYHHVRSADSAHPLSCPSLAYSFRVRTTSSAHPLSCPPLAYSFRASSSVFERTGSVRTHRPYLKGLAPSASFSVSGTPKRLRTSSRFIKRVATEGAAEDDDAAGETPPAPVIAPEKDSASPIELPMELP